MNAFIDGCSVKLSEGGEFKPPHTVLWPLLGCHLLSLESWRGLVGERCIGAAWTPTLKT
jgi:hypothetical protein